MKNNWQKEKFEKIFIRIPNKKYQINSSEYLGVGKFPVVDQGKDDVVGFCDNEEKVFKNNGVIVFGDHTRILKYIDYDFIIGADGTQLIKTREGFLNKFFYYNLLTKKIPNTGYNRHFKYIESEVYNVPPREEQERIVRVLECWDGYLEKLGRKIEVKKNIKKALMQKLLTGEKRLAGFSDKWQTVKLGDVCSLYQPKTISSDEITENGPYLVYGANGIIGCYDKYNHKESEILITCRGATCGCINFSKPKSWVTGNAMVAKPLENIDKTFLYYLLNYVNLLSVITGMAQPQITRKDLAPFNICIPKLEEQKAIAEILTKADDEITALEKKKEIVEAQKKFLLNNLVTGKILTPGNI